MKSRGDQSDSSYPAGCCTLMKSPSDLQIAVFLKLFEHSACTPASVDNLKNNETWTHVAATATIVAAAAAALQQKH